VSSHTVSDSSAPQSLGLRRFSGDALIASIVLASGAAAALLAVALLAKPFGGRQLVALIDLLPIPIYVGAGALAFFAARRSDGSTRIAWSLMAAGFVSYAMGDIIWSIYEVAFERAPSPPSFADPFYLAVTPLLLAGIMLLSSSARTLGQFRTILSGGLVVLGLAALVWEPILKPILATPDTGWPGTLVTAAYPVGDAFLVFAIFVGARRQWEGRARVVLYTFAAGLLLATGSDLAFARMVLDGTYETGSLVDLGWPVGFLLMGLAAGLSARWSVDFAAEIRPLAPSAGTRRARLVMSAVQVGLLCGLVAYGFSGGFSNDQSLMIILIAMASVALVRSGIAFADTGLLHKRLSNSRAFRDERVPGPPTAGSR